MDEQKSWWALRCWLCRRFRTPVFNRGLCVVGVWGSCRVGQQEANLCRSFHLLRQRLLLQAMQWKRLRGWMDLLQKLECIIGMLKLYFVNQGCISNLKIPSTQSPPSTLQWASTMLGENLQRAKWICSILYVGYYNIHICWVSSSNCRYIHQASSINCVYHTSWCNKTETPPSRVRTSLKGKCWMINVLHVLSYGRGLSRWHTHSQLTRVIEIRVR